MMRRSLYRYIGVRGRRATLAYTKGGDVAAVAALFCIQNVQLCRSPRTPRPGAMHLLGRVAARLDAIQCVARQSGRRLY